MNTSIHARSLPAEERLARWEQRTGPIVFAVFPQDPNSPCIHIPGTDTAIPTAELERLLLKHPTHSLGMIINPAKPFGSG